MGSPLVALNYFSFLGCCKPKKVEKHWPIESIIVIYLPVAPNEAHFCTCCHNMGVSQNCQFQFFDEFSNAAKCFLHMTATASFPVSSPTVDGSRDFLLFLTLCQNFLGYLFHKALAMASALYFPWDFRQALNAYLNSLGLPTSS